jgi:hypothetical protein
VGVVAGSAGWSGVHERLSGSEVEHDLLGSSPELEPVEMLTEYAAYQRLADGAPVVGVLLPFDAEALAARGAPPEVVGDLGALLLQAVTWSPTQYCSATSTSTKLRGRRNITCRVPQFARYRCAS